MEKYVSLDYIIQYLEQFDTIDVDDIYDILNLLELLGGKLWKP